MKKVALAVIMFCLVFPAAANAQDFAGTLKNIVLKAKFLDEGVVKTETVAVAGPNEIDNVNISISETETGYESISGTISMVSNNLIISFTGYVFEGGRNSMIGHVQANGSFDIEDPTLGTITNTFDASCDFKVIATIDKVTDEPTKAKVMLKLYPYNETNTADGNPHNLSIKIPAITLYPSVPQG